MNGLDKVAAQTKIIFDPMAGIEEIGDYWALVYDLMKDMTDRERDFCVVLLNFVDNASSGKGKYSDLSWAMRAHGFNPTDNDLMRVEKVLEKHKIFYFE